MTTNGTVANPPDRSHELHRLLTFVDAVAAIALTLLVLPLSDLASGLHVGQSVAALFREHESQFLAFLLSFVVIADLWFVQSRTLRPVVKLHPLVARALLVWSFTIVVLPFCTELVAQSGEDRLSRICYFGAITVSAASLGIVSEIGRRHPETIDPSLPASDPLASWSTAALLLIGLVVCLVIPAVGYYPLFLLLVSHPALVWWRSRHPLAGRPAQ
jgi:uncharacterized membrane protein